MSDVLRVIHVITKLELGGAQINTLYTVEHLDPERFQAFLVSGPGGILQPAAGREKEWIVAARLCRPIRPLQDLRAFFELRRILRRLRPQVVHTHSAKAGILGRLAARSLRVPLIVHSLHGFSFSPRQPLPKRAFFALAERLAAPLTHHFIFVAQADLAQARAKKLVRDNGTLIRSGFPLEKFRRRGGETAALRAKYGISPAAIVCGVVAPFKPQKGLLHLAAVAEKVAAGNPRVTFFLAGDGDLRPELEAALRKAGVADRFHMPGFVADIDRVMDIFDIGVSTALWEGLPQSLVQMRLKKIPLVVSDIPGHREVVCEGENGFIVDCREHERFAERILQLAADDTLRRRLGDFAYEDFSAWDADFMVREQEKLYLRLLAEKGISVNVQM